MNIVSISDTIPKPVVQRRTSPLNDSESKPTSLSSGLSESESKQDDLQHVAASSQAFLLRSTVPHDLRTNVQSDTHEPKEIWESGQRPIRSDAIDDSDDAVIEMKSTADLIGFFQNLDNVVQSKLPADILDQLNIMIENLDMYHDNKQEKQDTHVRLNQELNALYAVFRKCAQKTKQEMKAPDIIASLRDPMVCILRALEDLGTLTSASEVAHALENARSDIKESESKAHILMGFDRLQNNFDNNMPVQPEELIRFFETTFVQLNTLSSGTLRQISSALKPVLVDTSKVLEILIDQYLTQGINQQKPLELFNALLRSSKIHERVARFGKTAFDDLWVRFYTSQTKFHVLSGSESIAIFIRETYTDKQLLVLFQKIDFPRSKPNQHLRPLLEMFMGHTDGSRLRFVETMFAAKKLLYFAMPAVTGVIDADTMLGVLSQFCVGRPKTVLGYIDKHPAFLRENLKSKNQLLDHFHGTLNLTFLRNVKAHIHSIPSQYQDLFVRVVYFAALERPKHVQLSDDTAIRELASTERFSDGLNKLANYTLLQINTFVAQKLHKSVQALTSKSYIEAIDYLSTVLSHVTSVSQEKLSELEQIRLTQGKQKSGKAAVQELIRHVFKGRDPFNWDVTSINDRVLYLYCYFKYPFEKFREWTESLNKSENFYGADSLKHLFDTFDEKKTEVVGLNAIPKYGYKYIQNNQLTTILAAFSAAKAEKHFFAKLGTGQGKSLTLALMALQFAKEGKRVMIFSCYDHLAKRDHRNFSQLYLDFDVTARYIDAPNPTNLDAQVMYSNLDSFIKMYYANTNALGKGDKDAIADFPIFDVDVVLLDEFDALILDSRKIGNTVYNMKDLYQLGHFASTQDAKNTFKNRLVEVDGLRDFVNQGWSGRSFDQWVSNFSSQEGRTEKNYLGNTVSYVGGEWYELSRGNLYLYSSKLDVLSYLLSRSTVIGLSGSIEENSMVRIKDAITSIDSKQEIEFLNVPNFYGIDESKRSCVVKATNLSRTAWTSKILEDLDNCEKRPVLVFGDINNEGDWAHLRQSLEAYAAHHNRKFQIISDEAQTEDMSMVYACEPEYITLASHIVGRGADFKIHPDIDAIGGLHACIVAIPNDDNRLYLQMCGRVARMTNQGSYSVLLQGALPKDKNDPIEITSFEKEMNQVVRHVQKYLSGTYNKENWRRWFLLINMIIDQKTWPVSASSMEDLSAALIHAVTEEPESTIRRTLETYRAPKSLPRNDVSRQSSCVVS